MCTIILSVYEFERTILDVKKKDLNPVRIELNHVKIRKVKHRGNNKK